MRPRPDSRRTAALIFLLAAAGCRATPAPEAGPWPAAERGKLLESVAGVLRARGFRISYMDGIRGELVCWPRGVPTGWETWAGNAPREEWRAAANAGDLRHQLRVALPTDDDRLELRVEALVERRDHPLRRVRASMTGPAADLSALPEEWAQAGMQKDAWRPVGRDHDLETDLARAIGIAVARSR